MIRLVCILILQISFGLCYAQTCCSAGAPITSSLEIPQNSANSFSVQLGYEYKSINLLVDNNTKLENDPRTRFGQNVVAKVDYTLNKKWAFSAFLPLVHQSRTSISENQNSTGIGDMILLGQYSIFSNQVSNIAIGAGIKLPIGSTEHRGSSRIILSPDMQSGSGSIDYLFRASYLRSQFMSPSISLNSSVVYRKNGTNDSFGSSSTFEGRNFGFGDELVAQVGLNYLQIFKAGFLVPDLNAKIRWSQPNKEQGLDASNSGGYWLSVPFGLSFIPDENKSVRLYTEVPVYQQLEGLQISTNFTIGIQLVYNFINKKETIINF